MKLLLDTHLLLWALVSPDRIPKGGRTLIKDSKNELFFSAISVWEVAIKFGLGRPDFVVEPGVFRRELLANDYAELSVTGIHAQAVASLPALHKDPADRILVAQALTEGITLLTIDAMIVRYPGPIRKV